MSAQLNRRAVLAGAATATVRARPTFFVEGAGASSAIGAWS
jgi:hypothetical protein